MWRRRGSIGVVRVCELTATLRKKVAKSGEMGRARWQCEKTLQTPSHSETWFSEILTEEPFHRDGYRAMSGPRKPS